MTEKQAKEAGYNVKIGKFPFTASGKASAAGHKDGFVKVIFDEKFDPKREIKFKTYAEHRIRGAILDELRAQDWIPRSINQTTI